MQYINLPDKLNQPAPRRITGKEDFMKRCKTMLWFSSIPFPIIGASLLIAFAILWPSQLDVFVTIIGISFILFGVLIFYLGLKNLRFTIHLFDTGIMTNGSLVEIGRSDRGFNTFELNFKDKSGNSYNGLISTRYFNPKKYQLGKGIAIPVFYNESNPLKFTIYIPECGIGGSTAKKV